MPFFKWAISSQMPEASWWSFRLKRHKPVLLLNTSKNLFSLENPESPSSTTHYKSVKGHSSWPQAEQQSKKKKKKAKKKKLPTCLCSRPIQNDEKHYCNLFCALSAQQHKFRQIISVNHDLKASQKKHCENNWHLLTPLEICSALEFPQPSTLH